MVPEEKIHYLSPDRGIETLIFNLFSDLAKDPLHTYLIASTKQIVRSIQKRLDQESISYVPDQITTMDGFCRNHTRHDMTGVHILASDEAMGILGMLFDKHKKSFPLLSAYHRSTHIRGLFRFFGEITEHAIPFPECFHNNGSEKIKELGELYELYQEYLRQHHYVDEYGVIEHTLREIVHKNGAIRTVYFFGLVHLSPLEHDLILALWDHANKVDCTVPYGLDGTIFNPSDLYSYLSSEPQIYEPEIGDNSGFTGIFADIELRKNISHQIQTPIYTTIWRKEERDGEKGKRKEYISPCATKTEELTIIAKEIKRICRKEDLYEEITIAYPDPRDILPFLEIAFEEYQIPFHTSQSLPFSSHPFSQFCVNVLSLIEQGLSYQTLFPVIMSPYFKAEEENEEWLNGTSLGACLDTLMRWSHLERITDDDATYLIEKIENYEKKGEKNAIPLPKEVLLNTLRAYQDLKKTIQALKGRKKAREHAEEIITFLTLRINTSRCHDENERIKQIYGEFCTLLRNNIFLTSGYGQSITLEQYCNYTRQYIDQASLPGTSQRGVTVLGFRELAYETCPYLFLAGLNEGVFPRLTSRHPFATKEETREIGILKQEDVIRKEQYHFITALSAGKKAIYLSALNDENKNWIESPFFDQVIFNCHPQRWPSIDVDWEIEPSNREEVETELLESGDSDLLLRIDIEQRYRTGISRSIYDGIISNNPYIDQYLAAQFGVDAHWSVSKLEAYAHCPFRFWIERILHVKPLEDVDQKINFSEYGIFVHQILHDVYKTLQNENLLPLRSTCTEESIATLHEITAMYLSEQKELLPYTKARVGKLIGARYTGIGSLQRFIDSDMKYQDGSPLHMPIHFEFEFGGKPSTIVDLADPHDPDDPDDHMLFRGIIDRIDHIGDKYFGIIDYKTGTVPKTADIISGLSLQLPLYMYAYELLSGRVGIYGSHISFKETNLEGETPLYDIKAEAYIPYLSPRPKKIICDEIIEDTVMQTRKHIQGIRKGHFPITPRAKCPDEWCSYKQICRYDNKRGSESGEWNFASIGSEGGEYVKE